MFLLLRFFTFREERKRRKRGFFCKRKKREENVFHSLSVFFFPALVSLFFLDRFHLFMREFASPSHSAGCGGSDDSYDSEDE